ncbi:MAG: type I restriction enzyme HsdR N-terminal domain-containing protein [Parachlamydiaceae bacterium]|nr:type I restriction enzyme HsdR N-terminal domain-containing protein [Parachlamydiaceae bacterium]
MKPSKSLFCPIRKIWVADLPEENIRQNLIKKLIDDLGYPQGQIGLEVSLSHLPHLIGMKSIPRRRADLIVFAKDLHPKYALFPLLLIECKSVEINPKVFRQIVGYNQFVGACCIGAVNHSLSLVGWFNSHCNDFSFFSEIPSYEILLNFARQKWLYR